MAMKTCKECGKEVSTSAKACPHCGKTNPSGRSTAVKVVGGIVGGIILLSVCGRLAGGGRSNSPSATTASPMAPAARTAAVEVDARRLWQDYDANEVAADNQYKGRILKVRGTVASIDKNFRDDIVLHLASPNEFMSTMATMQKSQAAQAAALSKGERVVLICEGKGRVIGSPSLHDCTFAQ